MTELFNYMKNEENCQWFTTSQKQPELEIIIANKAEGGWLVFMN
jgi:hypothetical protein